MIQKEPRERYHDLSGEQKNKIQQCGRKQNKNLSEDENQKLETTGK